MLSALLAHDTIASASMFALGMRMPRIVVAVFANAGIWLLCVVVFLELYRRRALARFYAALLAQIVVYTYAINFLIGLGVERVRPYVTLGFQPIVDPGMFGKSFPSDHAAIAFALALFAFSLNKKIGLLCYAIACAVALGRVLAGVHYVIDVYAGALIGSSAMVLALFISQLWQATKGRSGVKAPF